MDGRIAGLWYLPEGWGKLSAPKSVAEYLRHPAALLNTASWPDAKKDKWEQIKKSPYIFFSRSPLTLGHSQLVIPSLGDCEQDLFRLASEIICGAISTFNTVFGNPKLLHEKDVFKPLAENTLTRGSYEKTLVLRASAQETIGKEYKVHLVPFFASHSELCKERFQSLHAAIPEQVGGLLGWLGTREDDVDKWEVDQNPTKPMLDVIANEYLRMADLAQEFREIWARMKKSRTRRCTGMPVNPTPGGIR
jgi:hypothetical protein